MDFDKKVKKIFEDEVVLARVQAALRLDGSFIIGLTPDNQVNIGNIEQNTRPKNKSTIPEQLTIDYLISKRKEGIDKLARLCELPHPYGWGF